MKCPDCDNGRTDPPLHVSWKPGCRPLPDDELIAALEQMTHCTLCKGTGDVPDEMQEWIDHGWQLRMLRRTADVSLRDGAKMLGIKPSELSAIEWGCVDNLSVEVSY